MFWSGIKGAGFFPFSTEGWFALLLGIGIVLAVVIVIVYLSKKISRFWYNHHYGSDKYNDGVFRALNKKYKDGEITKDEYESMKKAISNQKNKKRVH